MALTPEQRRRIYEEEKTRIEAQAHFAATRTGALESAIEDYQRRGYRIASRTETAVQLSSNRGATTRRGDGSASSRLACSGLSVCSTS